MQRESERGIFLFTLFKANELFDRSIYGSSYEYNLDVNIPDEAGTGILVTTTNSWVEIGTSQYGHR